MHPSNIARQLIVSLLTSIGLSGCGLSPVAQSPVGTVSPVSTYPATVPSPAPSAALLSSSTPLATQIVVDQPIDWSHIPGVGVPVHGEGVILTVIHVTDVSPAGNKIRPLIIDVRLRNESYPSLTISPSAFTVIHTSGTSFAVKNINFAHPPRDEKELTQNQQLQASLLLSAEFPIEELALQYVPRPDTPPVRIRLSAVSEVPDATLAQLDLTSLVFVKGDLPPSFHAGDVFTTVPPTLPLAGVEPPQRFVGQVVEHHNPRQIMTVMILFFNNRDSVDAVYTTVEQNGEAIGGIGESASWREMDQTIQFHQLTFTRCQAAAMILMSGRTEEEFVPKTIVLEYAKRLDQRLQRALCP